MPPPPELGDILPGDQGFYRSLRELPREMPDAPKVRRSVPPELAYAISLERLFWSLHMKGLGRDAVEILARSQRFTLRFNKKILPAKDLSLKQALSSLEGLRPSPALVPKDAETRKKALAFERWFTTEVADTVMWCLLRPPVAQNAAAYAAAKGAANVPVFADQFMTAITMRALDVVQSLCAQQSYLFGNEPTHADITAATVLAPIVRKQGWVWAGQNWSPMATMAGTSALARHPAANWVRMMYDLHTPSPVAFVETTRAWVP